MSKKRDFTLKVKIKGCNQVFQEDLGPGVISLKTISISQEEIEKRGKNMFAVYLLQEQEKMVQECIEVVVEEEES